uniref:Aquaporin n=1 Tax=Romanomermis culicivorax TaxID=13658 RepID=A0A915K880_ROMCU
MYILLCTDAINQFDGGIRQVYGPQATAGIFATYPQDYLSIGGGWIDQIVGTAVLTQLVFAVTDPRNHAVPKFLIPLLVGLVVTLIGLSLGFNCGFAINPARDLGPRIFTAMAGYGAEVFT